MTEYYAGGIVYSIEVDDKSNIGITRAKKGINDVNTAATKSDISLKSLSRETAVLGGSLASLGGTAMVAGTMIGGDLGGALQNTGMGMAFVGSGISSLVPAMRTMTVFAQGTLIPTLEGIGAAAYTALGPIGLLVLAVGGAITGYYLVNQAMDRNTDKAYDNKVAVDDLRQAYKELYDLQKEYAGIPEDLSDLEREYASALITAQEATEAKEAGTPEKRKEQLIKEQKEAAVPLLQAQDALEKAMAGGADQLTILGLTQTRDAALKVVEDYQSQIEAIEKGTDKTYAKLVIAEEAAWDRVEDIDKKIQEKKARKEEISPLVPQIYAGPATGETYLEEAAQEERRKALYSQQRQLGPLQYFKYLVTGELPPIPEEPESVTRQYYTGNTPSTPGPARVGDIVIHINGTVTDQTFRIPGTTLMDLTHNQGY